MENNTETQTKHACLPDVPVGAVLAVPAASKARQKNISSLDLIRAHEFGNMMELMCTYT